MMKLVLIGLLVVGFCKAAISSLQLVAPDDSYSILTNGQLSTTALDDSLSSLSNDISEGDKTSKAVSAESNESAAAAPQSTADASTAAPATGPAPAAITRVKTPIAALSAVTSTAGLSRGSLIISSTAQALATANSGSSNSPVASVRSTATIQHRILPAETIPLPISISTRPGLRTVIAPETLTIQQPGLAKVGEVVQQIPTAVSHQRQTIVHNHARVVTPIVAPAVRTLTSQYVRAYHTPLVYAPQVVENQD